MNSSTYPKAVFDFGRGPISANLRPFNFAASMLHVFLNGDIEPAILHDYIDDIYETVRLAEHGKDFCWWQEMMENICLITELLHSLVVRGSEHEERAKLTLEYFLKKGIPPTRTLLQIPAENELLHEALAEQLEMFN
jgi:hypothetical protein